MARQPRLLLRLNLTFGIARIRFLECHLIPQFVTLVLVLLQKMMNRKLLLLLYHICEVILCQIWDSLKIEPNEAQTIINIFKTLQDNYSYINYIQMLSLYHPIKNFRSYLHFMP